MHTTTLRRLAAVSLLVLATGVPSVFAAADAGAAGGVVFEDLNGDGARNEGEPGIAGVAVSNQHDVVLTGEDGAYSLPVTDDTVVFVVKPSGYSVPLNDRGLPQFYYVHKPAGSPKQQHAGVEPTGPLPDSINFPLRRSPEPDAFSVIAMADPQPETGEEVRFVRDDVLTELVGSESAFAMVLGDIMFDDLGLFYPYLNAVGKMGVPFYHIIGNHDSNGDAHNDADSDETFHRLFGPNYYAWNYGKVHFVALDDVEWFGHGSGKGLYRGAIGKEQLAWLEQDLATVPDDFLVVLTAHIPLWFADRELVADASDLLKVVEKRAKVLMLAGHMHEQEHIFAGKQQGWSREGGLHHITLGAVSGAWWSGTKDIRGIPEAPCRDGVPNGYAIVRFDGADYTTEYKPAGLDAEQRMRIYPPTGTALDREADRTLLVNVYDGSKRCEVTYCLDDGEYASMAWTPLLDPFASAILVGPLASGKDWVRPTPCQHMWSVELPEDMRRGLHRVTVQVKDHFGREYKQSRYFGFR